MKKFDAIIVGAGHAGIEAAFALARKKHHVALITLDINNMAMMPCNPSIGGPAKGIITREVDALGGMQGIFADKAMIQIKMLNESRGPAVRALRAQIDKNKYSELIKNDIVSNKYIDVIEEMATNINVKNNAVVGIKTEKGDYISSKVIITTGTYMDSYILRGSSKEKSGPDNQRTTNVISESLNSLGITMQRLKTGTPPRIYANSINFDEVEKEVLPNPAHNFSNRSNVKLTEQVSCYLTYTNEETHKIVFDNLDKSSMYSGLIDGIGPRYCPSIEDKIVRFKEKNRHQLFYEPETLKGDIIYLQGLSTSMPIDVQEKMLRTLPGMKDAKVQKWGYAIEYDAIDPLQLNMSLELKTISGLYFAGQVNGTSGYEEAAGQGLIAGINAALSLEGKKPLVLRRDEAYLGVLIDDLITKGTTEPYRMLTSRAEYRLLLRNDNADKRLSYHGHDVGLVSNNEYNKVVAKYKLINSEYDKLGKTFLSSNDPLAKKYNITSGPSLLQLLSRPDVDYHDISDFKYLYEVSVMARLKGYIKKQETEAKKMIRLESLKIPDSIDYSDILNIATEARVKLMDIKPQTIGQASRVPGVNPADIQMLMFYIDYKRKQNEN